MNSVIPGADIFGPPLAGLLADKLGNFRLFMAVLTFLNGASSLLLLAIHRVANVTITNHWMSETFWAYLAVRVLLDILRASSLMLFEGAVVSIIKQHGGDYGLQKLFGTLGAVIFGPLSGVLIDLASNPTTLVLQQADSPWGKSHDDHAYSSVIVLYFVLRVLTAICILKLDLDFKVCVL